MPAADAAVAFLRDCRCSASERSFRFSMSVSAFAENSGNRVDAAHSQSAAANSAAEPLNMLKTPIHRTSRLPVSKGPLIDGKRDLIWVRGFALDQFACNPNGIIGYIVLVEQNMSRTVKVATMLVGAAIFLGGIYYWRGQREIAVRTVIAQENVEVRVFGVGSVEAQILSKVGFQISGKLVAIHADQGDFVKSGTLLAKLDDSAQRAKLMKSEVALRQAAANLAKAQAQMDRARATYQQKKNINVRRQTLAARGTVSQEAADDAQTAEEVAGSDLRVVEADTAIAGVLQEDAAAQRQIDTVLVEQHELRAPFDARVISRHKELGSVTNTGEVVFTLIEPNSIWVRAYVDEALAGGLSVGQTAYVRLRSEPNQVFEAEVVRIDQENDRVTEERKVYVRCRVCNPSHQIRFLGEQAEVEIIKTVIRRGLFVPLESVEKFDGRTGVVWTLENGRLAKRSVQFGERLLDGRVQITTDLPDKAQVVAEVRNDLREGRAARQVELTGR
jgi:HlyD family secretion protein